MQVESRVSREIQEMVIDENKNDTITLASSCLVNHIWYHRARSHLFSRLYIRATRCRSYRKTVNAADEFEATEIPETLNPSFSFKKALETLPRSFGGMVKHLILTSASPTTRVKHTAQGIRLFRPELTACLVKAFIERFPRLESLAIEDVEWKNCTEMQVHCDCIESMHCRVFTSLILRSIWHHSVQMNATYVTQCASEIHKLVVEELKYEESDRPPYKELVVDDFTLSSAACPQAVVIPDMQPGRLHTIDITAMLYTDVELLKALLEKHGGFVDDLRISVVGFAFRPHVWNDIGLRQCHALRNFTLKCELDTRCVETNAAAQNLLLKFVAQLPRSNLIGLTLVFDTVLDATTTPEALLTPENWKRLAVQTGSFHRLEQITLIIAVPRDVVYEGRQNGIEFTKSLEAIIGRRICSAIQIHVHVEGVSTKFEAYDHDRF